MFKLQITARARKELKSISLTHQKALYHALEDIREDPLSGKPLERELKGRFSYKVGVYRLVYVVNPQNQVIKIITAGHRRIVYQQK